jgi:predicted dehydrogenase
MTVTSIVDHIEAPILIAGLGSVGRRHLRNLRALGCRRFVLYRSFQSTLPEGELAGLPVEHDLTAALAHEPVAVVIANPTSLHTAVARAAARTGTHLFVEKPLADSLTGWNEVTQMVRRHDLRVIVGFQYRFHTGLRAVKRWLEQDAVGPVVCASAHWGEYLPGWHPWEDHSVSYSARSSLGGGVILTLCHPFDYLRWLLGDVNWVAATARNSGYLGTNVEDLADITLEFTSGAQAHVHLDFVQRPPSQWLQITGRDGVIRWDNADGVARCYRAIHDAWEICTPDPRFERNTMFLDEMAHFLSLLRGDPDDHSPAAGLDDGMANLRIALAARQSAAEGGRRIVPADLSRRIP